MTTTTWTISIVRPMRPEFREKPHRDAVRQAVEDFARSKAVAAERIDRWHAVDGATKRSEKSRWSIVLHGTAASLSADLVRRWAEKLGGVGAKVTVISDAVSEP